MERENARSGLQIMEKRTHRGGELPQSASSPYLLFMHMELLSC